MKPRFAKEQWLKTPTSLTTRLRLPNENQSQQNRCQKVIDTGTFKLKTKQEHYLAILKKIKQTTRSASCDVAFKHTVCAQVVKGDTSQHTIQLLLQVNNVTGADISPHVTLRRSFPTLLEGGIGQLKHVLVKLRIHTSVEPVAQQPR